MDFDARIEWKPGMALTAKVLKRRDDNIEERRRAFIRTLMGSGQVGLLPGYEYHGWGAFSGKVYELTGLKVTAILPSGRVINIDEDLKIEVPSLTDGEYFLCLCITDRIHEFERDDIPYSRPEYELSILKQEKIDGNDILPLKRFFVEDGILQVDEKYIPPVIIIRQNEQIPAFMSSFADILSQICSHPNMQEGDCKHSLLRYFFRLKSFNTERPLALLLDVLNELAEAIDYFVVDGLGKSLDELPREVSDLKTDVRRTPHLSNILVYLSWLESYLKAQILLMDRIVITDDNVDYEQLKKEISEDLFARLSEELSVKLYEDLRPSLTSEITESVCDTVRKFMDENLTPELKEYLGTSLHDSLYPELYDSLYAELSKLQYRPMDVEEDSFIPII